MVKAMRSLTRGRGRAVQVATLALVAAGIVCIAEAAWIHAKADVAQLLIARAWHRSQANGAGDTQPWPWADTKPVVRLTAGTGIHELMVLEGSTGRNLAFGPTHDPASVLPGEPGNSVIEGHRDTHFAWLRNLHVGERLHVERADGQSFWFAVTDERVVDSTRWRILLSSDVPRLTLITCYPFDAVRSGGPLRLVVTADVLSTDTARRPVSSSSNFTG